MDGGRRLYYDLCTVLFSHPLPLAETLGGGGGGGGGGGLNPLGDKLPPCLDPPVDRTLLIA